MEVPKSIIQWVVGIVLATVIALAAQSYWATQSNAATAKDMNQAQDSELALVKYKLDRLEKSDEWQMEALKTLLRDRGLPEPR